MKFTDIFIRRPVLATVVSLLILVLGLRAVLSLPVLQYPRTENAIVTLTTTDYGANPELVAAQITTPLELAVAQANGIDYMTSTSQTSVSTITINLRLNYDSDKALTEINTKVNSVLNQLPQGSQQPVLTIKVGQTIDAMYIGFYSTVLAPNNVTDYMVRVVQPKLQAVPGVQTAEVIGGQNFALRAWLDPEKLAAYSLTGADISTALATNDYISGIGNTKGQMVQVNLNASTNLHSVDDFKNLIIKQSNGAVVRLKDVANVTLGADDYESRVAFDGKRAVYIGIQIAPAANLLDVLNGVKKAFPEIQKNLPQGLSADIIYDSSSFVTSSIHEVEHTLFQAVVIVSLVVFAFLGSPRSVFIPIIAILLSLVGTFFMMMLFGFTINLLTLLAVVLSIGLVVDDAIIIVENVNRHLEEGMTPLESAIQAARELAGPIIAMTIVLIAVYVPIGFQGGLTGALFTEFAFTLVGAVTISAIVALTLSPMLASKMLKPHDGHDINFDSIYAAAYLGEMRTYLPKFLRFRNWIWYTILVVLFPLTIIGFIVPTFVRFTRHLWQVLKATRGIKFFDRIVIIIDYMFEVTRRFYERRLHSTLNFIPVTVMFALLVLGSIYIMILGIQNELAPKEDQGYLLAFSTPAPNATLDQKLIYAKQVYDIFAGYPETFHVFQVDQPGQSIAGQVLKPWDQRSRTVMDLQMLDQAQLNGIAGAKIAAYNPSPLPGSNGLPFQFVIQTTDNFDNLNDVATKIYADAMKSGAFFFMDNDLKIDDPQSTLEIDRNKAADLGLSMTDIGNAMGAMLGGGYVNYFSLDGRPYKVIPQVQQKYRLNASQLLDYQIRTANGGSVPLSTVVKITTQTVPESLNHFQQINSATLAGVSGLPQGDAINVMKGIAAKYLPAGYTIDYGGETRQFVQESSGFVTTFVFALIIIFLALAAQFESFRDPVVILVSVPMSIAGALLFILLFGTLQTGGATLNIYTKVGLVTLMGLISKHGILIVEFANHIQQQGKTKREAIEMAAGIRLRPILMTTAAMVLGMIPLIFASGAGAVSRFAMGLVIASGIAVGTLFTLFVVPAFYMLIAADHHDHPEGEAARGAGLN